jgi:hypothetical protein
MSAGAEPPLKQQEAFMLHHHSYKDPTEFFSVVGAPYVRESHLEERPLHQLRIESQRPRRFEIGVATASALFCVLALGASLFADNGARFAELARHVW